VTAYLLDASVLIAAVIQEHGSHLRVSLWLGTVERIALCPITEGALVRFLVRIGERASTAAEIVRRWHGMDRCAFWPDSISFRDADMTEVVGHRQVTDAYLAALAVSRGAILATLDEGLAGLRPHATLLVPGGPDMADP
jgi:predicted nucleic acid-binding protein